MNDPQFGLDVGFFVFVAVPSRYLTGFGFMALFLALLLVGGGALPLRRYPAAERIAGHGGRPSPDLVDPGLICLLKAVAYWLDRHALALKDEDFVEGFTGLKYRDVEAVLPAKTILTFIAWSVRRCSSSTSSAAPGPSRWWGLGLLAISALVIGGIYPAIVQQFQVRPNEPGKEAPYISRNIQATRDAYNLTNVQSDEYSATGEPDPASLAADRGRWTTSGSWTRPSCRPRSGSCSRSVPSTRSPTPSTSTGTNCPGVAAGDRQHPRGGSVSRAAGAAELGQRHAGLHHGYGLVAAYDNTANPEGGAEFFAEDIPPTGELEIDQPRVYFGEKSPTYSIVGGPADPVSSISPTTAAPPVSGPTRTRGSAACRSDPR